MCDYTPQAVGIAVMKIKPIRAIKINIFTSKTKIAPQKKSKIFLQFQKKILLLQTDNSVINYV